MRYIIGIDEAGRGPLAGPVTVGAVIIPFNLKSRISKLKPRDSKKLNARQREEWFVYVKNHPKIFYAVANVYPRVIDRINISGATNLAAGRACLRLLSQNGISIEDCNIFLDYGLLLPENYKLKAKKLEAVVHGDELIPVISLASIVAKVKRDKLMTRLHKKFPEYGFDKHKGYGTKAHVFALKKIGLSPAHRKSFMFTKSRK